MRDTSGGPCLAGMATPHWNLLHILSTLLIGGGFVLLEASGGCSMRRSVSIHWQLLVPMRTCAIRSMLRL